MPRDRFADDDDDRYDDRPRRRRERDDDRDDERYDDEDDRRPEEPSNGPAMVSMVLGIISFAGGITAIPGLICGFVGLSKAKKLNGVGKGQAVTGTVLSGVGVVVLGLTVWLVIWFLGRNDQRRDREVASNNLKQIGLAMHNFESSHGEFSTGVATTMGGNPNNGRPIPPNELATRLSWRVDILPYIEQDNLYRQAMASGQMGDGMNRVLETTVVSQFADPDARTDPNTRYRTFYGPGTTFDPARPSRMRITSIMDGTSNTIFVAEAGEKVPWSRFGEIKFDENNPPQPSTFGRAGKDSFQVLMFDGSVRNTRKTLSPLTFKHAITPAGGEVMDWDW